MARDAPKTTAWRDGWAILHARVSRDGLHRAFYWMYVDENKAFSDVPVGMKTKKNYYY